MQAPKACAFDPSWRTCDAVWHGQSMNESRNFSPVPIPADTPEDAGCVSDDILTHCRDPRAVHVRGCRVVGSVFGKEWVGGGTFGERHRPAPPSRPRCKWPSTDPMGDFG